MRRRSGVRCMPKSLTLGIDLGGTGIKLGLVDPSGTLLRTLKVLTPPTGTPRHIIDVIVQQAKLLLGSAEGKKIRAIGVGTAGDVDPDSGAVRISPNLRWKNVPLKA